MRVRDRERERQTDRQTETDRDRERDRDRQRQRQRDRDRDRERQERAEKDREYLTEPKSRVRVEIACVAGGLRGCESGKKPTVPFIALSRLNCIHADRQLRRLEPTMLVKSSHESLKFTKAFEQLPPILVPEAIM